jgi:RNA polymerase sigma-70 factor (ECF subfamily)
LFNLLYPLITKDKVKLLTDEEAVTEYVSSQNPAYFDLLYKRYSSKVFGKCISLLRDEGKAEDAMQEIFIKIILNLSKFSGKSKFSTWLYSITYNYCIDTIRKAKKDKSMLVEDMSTAYDVEDEVEDKFLLETKVERLEQILAEISAGDKSILLMKYQDGLSIKEIGGIFNKSESAIKMKIKRAKHKFRRVYSANYKD